MNKFKDDDLQLRAYELHNKDIFSIRSNVKNLKLLFHAAHYPRYFYILNEFRCPVWYKPWTWFRRYLKIMYFTADEEKTKDE